MTPFLTALLVIGLAELGDKTQLLTFSLATRYNVKSVISGVILATALLQFVAVVTGGIIYKLVPQLVIKVFAGFLFILFGVWFALTKEAEENVRITKYKNPLFVAFITFFLAEFGDKTQLATMTLATKYPNPYHVWLGATLGMGLVNITGALIGRRFRTVIPWQKLKWLTAAIFVAFGILTFLEILQNTI